MVWALKHAPVDDAIAHLVLIGLADHARADGRGARPSQSTLADYCAVTDRTIRTKLRHLEELGLIRPGDAREVAHLRADQRPLVWDLVLSAVKSPRAEGGFRSSRPENPSGRKQDDTTTGSTVHERPEAGRPNDRKLLSDRTVLEPSIEPSIEPSSEIDAPGARDDVEAVCSAVAEHVYQVTGRRPKVLKAWRRDARLMLDRDERSLEAILGAVHWVGRDAFWASNILSPQKLRAKWDTLQAQARRRSSAHLSTGAASTAALVDSHRRLFPETTR